MFRPGNRYVVWWLHEGVSVCDYTTMMFFNRHAMFSKMIFFVEIFNPNSIRDVQRGEPKLMTVL